MYVLSTYNTELHSSPSLDSFHHSAKANFFKKLNSPFDYASLYIYFKNKGHKLVFFFCLPVILNDNAKNSDI